MMYIYSKINIPSITTNQTKEIMQKRKKETIRSQYIFSEIYMDDILRKEGREIGLINWLKWLCTVETQGRDAWVQR